LRYAIGVDVGGTKIAVAMVDSEGKVGAKIKVQTDRCASRVADGAGLQMVITMIVGTGKAADSAR
jgi:predicted NBD/HSP70 family sugar kinase